jgi:hypothetical protein
MLPDGIKWDKAADKRGKDMDALLILYDFLAEHWWKHSRTSNPTESTFATIRHAPSRCLYFHVASTDLYRVGLDVMPLCGAEGCMN